MQLYIHLLMYEKFPFGDFRKAGMQHFLSVAIPGYIAPTRQTVCKKLATQYAKYHENLKEIFKKPTYIALTTDAWKNSNLSHFLCITAHFYDDNFSMTQS